MVLDWDKRKKRGGMLRAVKERVVQSIAVSGNNRIIPIFDNRSLPAFIARTEIGIRMTVQFNEQPTEWFAYQRINFSLLNSFILYLTRQSNQMSIKNNEHGIICL